MRNAWTVLGAGLMGSLMGSAITSFLWCSSHDAYAAPQDEAVRAQKFQLIDSKGNVRGEWGVRDDGAAYFRLRQSGRQAGIWMAAGDNGSTLSMNHGDDKAASVAQVLLSLDKDGQPSGYLHGRTAEGQRKTLWEVGK